LELGTDNIKLFFTAISEFLLLSVQRFFGMKNYLLAKKGKGQLNAENGVTKEGIKNDLLLEH